MLQALNHIYAARESQRRTVSRGIIEQSIGSLATHVDFMNKLEVSRIVRNNNGSSGNYQIQTPLSLSQITMLNFNFELLEIIRL